MIEYNWVDFKPLILANISFGRYVLVGTSYLIWFEADGLMCRCFISTSETASYTDFVDNVKNSITNVDKATLVSGTVAFSNTGGATEAAQTTGNGHLSNINTKQDYANFESSHQTLSANTDTTITFSASVRLVRVTNWDILNVILVKNGAISSNTDATASRVGIAALLNIPNSEVFPITTSSIHVRSAAASVVTVEGFS